jgi:hypothetical protein
VLRAARSLIADRARVRHELRMELFFAGCIFEPEKRLVHGDFSLAEISSHGQWPRGEREPSSKGPYGSSGYYGKEEEGWVTVWEDEFLRAAEKGWVAM